jgi:hypothetical protein
MLKRKFCKKHALNNLIDITSCFNNKIYLGYGTALGALREGSIFDHDYDTDMIIFDKDFSLDDFYQLKNIGFNLTISGENNKSIHAHTKRDNVSTCIFVLYQHPKQSNILYNFLWFKNKNISIIHQYNKNLFSIPEIVSLHEHSFLFWGTRYIEAVYGEDWMIPRKKWNSMKCHKCLVPGSKDIDIQKKFFNE